MSKCASCGKEYSKKCHLRNLHYSKNPEHAPEDWDRCQMCGEPFERLGHHWAASNCSYMGLSENQTEILTGILMGDGSIGGIGKNNTPYFIIHMKNEEYLEYLNKSVFPLLYTGVNEQNSGMFITKY
jgi:hypothetical protein